MTVTADQEAASLVGAVRDDPARRLQLACSLYEDRYVWRTTRAPLLIRSLVGLTTPVSGWPPGATSKGPGGEHTGRR